MVNIISVIPHLIRVVHEVGRVAEGASRVVTLLITTLRWSLLLAVRVVGLSPELVIYLGSSRPLLYLLIIALPPHLFVLEVLDMGLEIRAAAATAYERPISHEVARRAQRRVPAWARDVAVLIPGVRHSLT